MLTLYIFFAFDLLLIIFLTIFYPHLPPQIPLFYSKPWGEDQLAEKWMIFLLPVLSHTIFLFNSILYNKLYIPNTISRNILQALNIFVITITSLITIKLLLTFA